ncbi:hypothetical protein C7S18_05800 [Ahniella affigens]|uniref:TonB-dependent transporter Oar-like beta-barrel domain-containing protein n=1 Tax=Ahniella affigens TaxID=2021234 RepID=A0A2P1PPG7_9GAMM|nr:TonB-dependent receptor [Ahniella affigens]AVP96741.1 hypothetical protein C7S18_05800 [Ahniella affigens]
MLSLESAGQGPTRARHRTPRLAPLAAALAACLMLAGPAVVLAQSATATLRGTLVHTDSGPTTIRVTHLETGLNRTTEANAQGRFTLTGLPPGQYRVELEHQGKVSQQTVRLRLGETVRLNRWPEPDAQNSTPAVQPPLEARTSEVAHYLSPEQIARLPQTDRNVLNFVDLVPGVAATAPVDGPTQVRGNGLATSATSLFVDGVRQNNDVVFGGVVPQQRYGAPLPQSAVAELKVIPQNYRAAYAQVSGPAVAVATHSGTNTFEGTAFVDHVADNWYAMTPQQRADDMPSEASDTQHGVTFGGPIVPDLLHFYLAYEGTERDDQREIALGGNQPASNLPNDLLAQLGSVDVPFDQDLLFGKLSYAPGDSHRFELSAKHRSNSDWVGFGGTTSAQAATERRYDDTRIDVLHQFHGRNVVSETHLTYENVGLELSPVTAGPSYVLFNVEQNGGLALITGGGIDQQDFGQRGFGIQNELTWSDLEWHGAHVITIGTQFKAIERHAERAFLANARFEYDARFSTSIPNFGAIALPRSGVSDLNIESDNRQYGLFVQDDWDVTDRLTLNLGVRWDYEVTPSYLDQVTDPTLAAALRGWSNLQNTDYEIDDYISSGNNRDAFKDAFAPRLGFAYDFSGDDTQVLFGGAGRAYDRNLFQILADEQFRGQQAVYALQFNNPGSPCSGPTCLTWDPRFLDVSQLATLVANLPRPATESDLITNDLRMPYSDQFSLGFRQTFGDWTGSVTASHIQSKDGLYYRIGNRYADGSFVGPFGPPFGQSVPGHGLLLLIDNGLSTRQNALLLALDKPYTESSGYGVSLAYTFSDASENQSSTVVDDRFVLDFVDADAAGWHRSVAIPRHRLVLSGLYDGAFGIQYAAKASLESPSTFEASNCLDAVDFAHCTVDPFTPSGTFGRKQFDLSASRDWQFDAQTALTFRIDILNLFNHRNWNSYDTWRGSPGAPNATFGDHFDSVILPTRTVKATIGFRW